MLADNPADNADKPDMAMKKMLHDVKNIGDDDGFN